MFTMTLMEEGTLKFICGGENLMAHSLKKGEFHCTVSNLFKAQIIGSLTISAYFLWQPLLFL
ncbi:hypothetical protein Bealeia1_01896 [Candidatus Bealeia paramacronuclearis]|uniref:Uncharacterized protein n=1 Tax=Candidatus Bealeia paramacronuclearis TaxID=1921001 RepID=A0ABZ2C9A3_9PROT|nr:hypothetical protein [Candidatus Bealeia paramacronuclearis]